MPRLVHIEDPADPRIEPYRQVRERDLVGRRRSFVVEGEVVLRSVVRDGRWPLSSVLLAQKRVTALAPILDQLPAELTVYTAAQAVLDGIVGFHIHRGVLAIGEKGAELEAEAILSRLGDRAIVVVAFGIGNHDNIGGIFRNAAAFGADAVLLGPDCCDPLYRKAIRVSVGAALTVPFARLPADEDPVALLARHHFEPIALSPSGKTRLADLARPERCAVLLGSEGPGLPDELMARARTVAIPMAGAFNSLNVATTSGIVLHHLVFGR